MAANANISSPSLFPWELLEGPATVFDMTEKFARVYTDPNESNNTHTESEGNQ